MVSYSSLFGHYDEVSAHMEEFQTEKQLDLITTITTFLQPFLELAVK